MNFVATKAHVANRGTPPDEFLCALVAWGKTAPDEIFAPNANPADIYAFIRPDIGPWTSLLHRRAAMLEALRVLAGFESSWNWSEGRDTTARGGDPSTYEAGAWQVSYDSRHQGPDLLALIDKFQINDADDFQARNKDCHEFAMEYIARLLRHTVRANGPVLRHEINPWLSRAAVTEFEAMLA